MSEPIEFDGFSLEGELKRSPLMLQDLVIMDERITKAYAYCNSCPQDVKEYLEPVLGMASDHFVEICDDMGIDALTADFSEYHHIKLEK